MAKTPHCKSNMVKLENGFYRSTPRFNDATNNPTKPVPRRNAILADFQERTNEIITLTDQNETLTSQLGNATTDLNTMKALVENLRKQVEELKTVKSNPRRPNRNKDNKSYGWMHGRSKNNGHTIKTCRNKADGHESEATLENKMGGSTRFCADARHEEVVCNINNKLNKDPILNPNLSTCNHLGQTNTLPCILDSECTSHYLQNSPKTNNAITTTQNTVNVQLPNGAIMSSNKTTTLDIPEAWSKGNTAHVFKDLATGNLLSVGQLCDDGYRIHFTKAHVILSKNGKMAAQGKRVCINGMWYINLPIPKPSASIANFVLLFKPIEKAIQFLHAACLSPCISTWCDAIDNGIFKLWPILTSKHVRQRFEVNASATVKGHMTQERQNLQSTSKINFAINKKETN